MHSAEPCRQCCACCFCQSLPRCTDSTAPPISAQRLHVCCPLCLHDAAQFGYSKGCSHGLVGSAYLVCWLVNILACHSLACELHSIATFHHVVWVGYADGTTRISCIRGWHAIVLCIWRCRCNILHMVVNFAAQVNRCSSQRAVGVGCSGANSGCVFLHSRHGI